MGSDRQHVAIETCVGESGIGADRMTTPTTDGKHWEFSSQPRIYTLWKKIGGNNGKKRNKNIMEI